MEPAQIFSASQYPKKHLYILFLLPLLVFSQCVFFNLTGFDDSSILQDINNRTKDIPKSEEMLRDAALQAMGQFGSFFRPLQWASYIVDSTISGTHPWMYHVSNILIHLLTVFLLYLFLRLHTQELTAFIVAAFFSIHPLFASSLAWIPSRGDSMIGLFGIALLLFFHLHITTKKILYYVLHLLMLGLALYTKETSVLFPVMLTFYYFFVLHGHGDKKIGIMYIAAWVLLLGTYFPVRSALMGMGLEDDCFGLRSFIQNLSVLPTLIGQAVIPYHLSTLPLYYAPSFIIGCIVSSAVVFFVFRFSRTRQWLPLFGLGWFLLLTIPPMFYRLPNADYFFTFLEHRAYLPMIGFMCIITPMLDQILQIIPSRREENLLFVIFVFAVFAFIHTRDYRNNTVFWEQALNQNSNNASAYSCRGMNYYGTGNDTLALADLNHAIAVFPDPQTIYKRGLVKYSMHDTLAADSDYTAAISLDTTNFHSIIYVDRAVERSARKNYTGAIEDLNKAVIMDSTMTLAFYNRGNIFLELHENAKALEDYNKSIKLEPKFTNAILNRGIAHYELKDYQSAVNDYRQVIFLSPTYFLAYNNMGVTLRELNQYDDAIDFFNKALSLNNQFSAAYYGRATVELKLGQLNAACQDFSEAARLGYGLALNYIKQYCH